MDFSPELPQPQDSSSQTSTLQVDFSWKKFKALISEQDKLSGPLYILDFNTFKSPHIIFKSATDDETIGTGTLHPISINANYEIHGQKGTLKALKRFKTEYTHLSHAYSNNDTPAVMTWISSCGFKTWDFICLDEQQNAVAKFSANLWAVKKVGNIELVGPKARSQAAIDEIVVVSLTLVYCMILRCNSLLSFFGAIFARPGPIDNEAVADSRQGVELRDRKAIKHD